MISIPSGGVGRLGFNERSEQPMARAPRRLLRQRMLWMAVVVMAALSAGSVAGFLDTTVKHREQGSLLLQSRAARSMLQRMLEAQAAMRGYVLTERPSYLQSYYAAVSILQNGSGAARRALDATTPIGGQPLSNGLVAEMKLWDDVIAAASAGNQTQAVAQLGSRQDKPTMDALRATIDHYLDSNIALWERRGAALDIEQNLLLIISAGMAIATVLALTYALRRSGREAAARDAAVEQAVHAREQAIAGREEVRQVFAMAEALQSADGLTDAAAILRSSATRLMPQIGGALYVFNHLRDRLDLVIAWDPLRDDVNDSTGAAAAAPFLVPGDCWALKRSKPHLNGSGIDALRCCHAPVDSCSLEVPMLGRGEPIGLLVLSAHQQDGADRLLKATDVACVLADSTSLALSSIMLREKLRDQAVRDSLTGLYNRRFLAEMLPSMASQALRRHASLTAMMIDLDHFKRLNDEHGHAMGDAVLKAVGAALLTALRGSDVACRYGGEELVVLMPDCTLEMARAKAEQIRERIGRLTREDGPQISASIGVAALPCNARDADELLASADAALYQAKQQGRNRVVTAAPLVHPLGLSADSQLAAPILPDWRAAIGLAALELAGPYLPHMSNACAPAPAA